MPINSFQADLAKEYNFKVISPSDLGDPHEPEKVVVKARKSLGYLDGLVLNHAYSVNAEYF